MRGRVLIVDDDADLGETLAVSLDADGFETVVARNAEDALQAVIARPLDAVLTDVRMQGLDGLELCRRIREVRPSLPVVVMTAFGDMQAAVGAIRAGAYDFLAKPVDHDGLLIVLDRAVEHARLHSQIVDLQQRLRLAEPFEELLGESPPVAELCSLIGRAAASDATVLIRGETGTGKELVANALHRRSPRRDGPFVAINCAAVPEALLESELFGHVKGAFTDARADRRGLFQRAQGGTVFLDEVGDMPLALQAKLLRVLQDRRARPVGSDEESAIDVRVVAATHRDLEQAVEDGSFRQDLLYRLNVIQLDVPALRERGNDVLLLAQHFLEVAAQRSVRSPTGFAPETASRLLAYDWPGNVRELQNCVERAVALSVTPQIVIGDLPPKLRQHTSPAPSDGPELIALEHVERRHILAVLDAVEGNKARAATILGIGRKTLYRKLEQYGTQPASPNSSS